MPFEILAINPSCKINLVLSIVYKYFYRGESCLRRTLMLLSCSLNFLRAQYLNMCILTHELIVNFVQSNECSKPNFANFASFIWTNIWWVYWLYLVVLYLNLLLPGGRRLGSTLQRASSVNAAGRISMIHIFSPVLATIMLNFTLVLNKTNLSYLNCLIFPHRVTELPFKTVSIKWGLPTANYRLQTGYRTRTRYKMQATYETWTMDGVYI